MQRRQGGPGFAAGGSARINYNLSHTYTHTHTILSLTVLPGLGLTAQLLREVESKAIDIDVRNACSGAVFQVVNFGKTTVDKGKVHYSAVKLQHYDH